MTEVSASFQVSTYENTFKLKGANLLLFFMLPLQSIQFAFMTIVVLCNASCYDTIFEIGNIFNTSFQFRAVE